MGVRHWPPAGAHASPPCPATALHLTCGEADNPSEADQHHDPENSPHQRPGWGTPACLAVAPERPQHPASTHRLESFAAA